MASFVPHMSWNLHTGRLETDSAETGVARLTVHSGAVHASRLVLPLVAGGPH